MEILFRDIVATGEGAWAPSTGVVPDNIGSATDIGARFDKDNDALLYGLGGSSNEPYLNPHDVQDIPYDLDIHEKGKKKVSPKVKDRKRKKGAEIFGQHLNCICDVLESRTTTTKNNLINLDVVLKRL
ncbi:hypothetical protein CJ030_MR2G016871 [Morella rubra]|uniref:Uncharacterized protein n=1 Tax=Morella rubra TaxID=262757 RepID=A0A6A1WF73_9ROSI|nr:hypothetical protein CJ030_MR2G016871 [Morella rubra]